MALPPPVQRPVLGWTAIVSSFVLAGLAFALVGTAPTDDVGTEERAAAFARAELAEARRALELASLEVVALRMLDGVGADGDRQDRLAAASADVQEAGEAIEALTEGNGSVAAEASALLEEIEDDVLDAPMRADASDLFDVAEHSARNAGAVELVDSRSAAIQQLSFVQTLPLHVMIEGIAADASVNDRSVAPGMDDFVEQMVVVVRTEGGWFGTDPAKPLVEAVWIDIDDAREQLPDEESILNELVSASDLVAYDSWMRELGDGDDPPPFGLDEMMLAADGLQPDLEMVIAQLVADENAATSAMFAERQLRRTVQLGAAVVAGGLGLIALAAGVASISRTTRASQERARLAMTDALTGVGNRHELDAKTRALTMDRRFARHLVVMIDLDRFKMVNDVHGHPAGDAVLVGVATRLRQIAERIERNDADAETSVIRLGGDEFLLTVHTSGELDDARIRAEVDAVRADSITFQGERIGLGFSVGIVLVDGRNELTDLMSTADLRVYDDKADRVQDRSESRSERSHRL